MKRDKLFQRETGFEDDLTEDIQHDLRTWTRAPAHLQDQQIIADMREELFRRGKKESEAVKHGTPETLSQRPSRLPVLRRTG